MYRRLKMNKKLENHPILSWTVNKDLTVKDIHKMSM